MCGIAGIIAFDGRTISAVELRSMTDCMVQRGPDDDGVFSTRAAGLAMRRLSIIDVEGGHQPISNESGDLHLVLNGEIYNHIELRQQLEGRGHTFRTYSDAEVVLHLYEERGTEALDALNGMFAFALYDARRQALWVARDRLGIKPLFYGVTGSQVAFASDIRALRAVFPTEVDPAQAINYLALGYSPGEETVWRGVRKLPPAHYLRVEQGRVTTTRYWSLGNIGGWRGSEDAAAAELETLLADAVRLELRSDVPLGVFLSGGLDSSTIVALAAEQVSEPLRTFTIQFEGKGGADVDFSRQVAARYATAHEELTMTSADGARALDELLPLMDEPIADSAIIPAYWLSKAARAQGIKVLLNGAGGDEIFGGYRRHAPATLGTPTWVAERLPAPLRRGVAQAWSVVQPHRGARAWHPSYAWATSVTGVNLHTTRQLLRDPADYRTLLGAMRRQYRGLNGDAAGLGYAHARMNLDVQTYLPDNVLSLTDKATMAASVEGRVPLLDHRLVEFAFSLPDRLNMPEGEPKGLLKRVMRDRLPAALLRRRKEGFNAPDDVWLRDDLGFDLAGELLEQRSPVLDALVAPVALEAVLSTPARRSASASMLFSLFLLNRWHRAQLAR